VLWGRFQAVLREDTLAERDCCLSWSVNAPSRGVGYAPAPDQKKNPYGWVSGRGGKERTWMLSTTETHA